MNEANELKLVRIRRALISVLPSEIGWALVLALSGREEHQPQVFAQVEGV